MADVKSSTAKHGRRESVPRQFNEAQDADPEIKVI